MQKNDDVVNCQVSLFNLEIELNKKHEEIVKQEQILQEMEAQSNNYKIKLETALKKIIDITRNQHLTQNLTKELDKLHQELTEKQNLLNIEISRADTTEKALKSANNSLNVSVQGGDEKWSFQQFFEVL
jgi:cell division FtsZ-interacting protein ZapD